MTDNHFDGQYVLAMRRQVDHAAGVDHTTETEMADTLARCEAALSRLKADGGPGLDTISRYVRKLQCALSPDYDETIHRPTCLWVQRHQEGRWVQGGDMPRLLVRVPIDDVADHATECDFCFGELWRVGEPWIPGEDDDAYLAWRAENPNGAERQTERTRSRRRRQTQLVPPTPAAPRRPGEIKLGDTVTVRDETGRPRRWTVATVDSRERPAGTVSPTSPVGAALLGAVVGETIIVRAPAGPRNYAVVAVEHLLKDAA